ncbi:hypothetical protein QBC43DRAFT_288781 [Cladorrhinum sp. PSN259]|nr:hypothetical protein QBC43DRAFT_288781 [Cladorrhinum sp. PSN259]
MADHPVDINEPFYQVCRDFPLNFLVARSILGYHDNNRDLWPGGPLTFDSLRVWYSHIEGFITPSTVNLAASISAICHMAGYVNEVEKTWILEMDRSFDLIRGALPLQWAATKEWIQSGGDVPQDQPVAPAAPRTPPSDDEPEYVCNGNAPQQLSPRSSGDSATSKEPTATTSNTSTSHEIAGVSFENATGPTDSEEPSATTDKPSSPIR